MFTGIIHGQGRLEAVRHSGRERLFAVRALCTLEDIVIGESIAVNGACLTVESGGGGLFTAYASAETLARTNLSRLHPDALVNLERALAIGQRLGGHLVSGHVDCLATVHSVRDAGQSLCIRLAFPAEYGELVIPKGSVALDGVSLTVNTCGDDFLEVNVIPETRRATTIASWIPGTRVNMEADMIGKYVRRMLAPRREGAGTARAEAQAGPGPQVGVDERFLREHGFI